MSKRILITDGTGFIGSHLADDLLQRGHHVRVLQALAPYGPAERNARTAELCADIELLHGSVEDHTIMAKALIGVDAVYHLAAKVGMGQGPNPNDLDGYTESNAGTAVLLESLLKRPVERLIVASSMSIYGEGLYRDSAGALVPGGLRSLDQLRAGQWELRDSAGDPLTPVPTPETKAPSAASIHAMSKFDQERMCLLVGRAYGIPTVALRFFSVYGPCQSPSNPYASSLAMFASQLLSDARPIILEDGQQRRDFVNIRDITQACCLALAAPGAPDQVFNIGSGRSSTLAEIATHLAQVLGKDLEPKITRHYRVGDIRHCFADISRAREVLGYAPQVSFDQGFAELAAWLDGPGFARMEGSPYEMAVRGPSV